MTIDIINGPNLNLLGKREVELYGNESFESYLEQIRLDYPEIEIRYLQSNSEGELIDYIQQVGFEDTHIILNAGGYSHTSIALSDAICCVNAPLIEVHLTNIYKRESYRRHSYISENAIGTITGLGLDGYRLAIDHFIRRNKRD